MQKSIAILGVGAIGGSIAVDLRRAGYELTLIDQWPAHVEAMKAHGLRVVIGEEELHADVRAYHLCDVCSLNQQFDTVLLAAKSNDTRWMAEFIKPYVTPDGMVVSLQNSLNDQWIAPIVGSERDVGCVVELSAELFTPGLIRRNTTHQGTWFGVGELDGRITPRLQELQSLLSWVGRCSTTTNIWGAKWTKLITNTMDLAPFAMVGLGPQAASELPGMLDLCIRVGRESLEVGKRLGYQIEPIFGMTADQFMGSTDETLERILRTIVSHVKKSGRNCILHDHLKKRHSEVSYINGLVVAKGKELDIRTPANAAITEVTRRIQAGELEPNRSNLGLVQHLLQASSAAMAA